MDHVQDLIVSLNFINPNHSNDLFNNYLQKILQNLENWELINNWFNPKFYNYVRREMFE